MNNTGSLEVKIGGPCRHGSVEFLCQQCKIDQLELKVAELTKQRTDLQLKLEQEREIQKRSGLMLSAALRGDKRRDEPENSGRLEAVRSMQEENEKLKKVISETSDRLHELSRWKELLGWPCDSWQQVMGESLYSMASELSELVESKGGSDE